MQDQSFGWHRTVLWFQGENIANWFWRSNVWSLQLLIDFAFESSRYFRSVFQSLVTLCTIWLWNFFQRSFSVISYPFVCYCFVCAKLLCIKLTRRKSVCFDPRRPYLQKSSSNLRHFHDLHAFLTYNSTPIVEIKFSKFSFKNLNVSILYFDFADHWFIQVYDRVVSSDGKFALCSASRKGLHLFCIEGIHFHSPRSVS